MKTVEYVIVANIDNDTDAGVIGDIFNMGLDAYEDMGHYYEVKVIEQGEAKVLDK